MTLRARTIGVDIDARCTACGLCLATCPDGVLRPGRKKPVAAVDRCTACLACVEVCPVDAITVDLVLPTP